MGSRARPEEAALNTRKADAAQAPGAAEPASQAGGPGPPPTASPAVPAAPAAPAGPAGQAEIPLERSLPGPSFTAEAEFAREREAVLFADWFCVGREESLAGPGDYLTADVAGESILVVRDTGGPKEPDGPEEPGGPEEPDGPDRTGGPGGSLAGFYNLCRHRGSRLVPVASSQPDGEAARSGCAGTTIRCPYHGWTYGLDGSLRSARFLPELRRYRD